MNQLETLVRRLNKLNLKLEIIGNYPWLYLYKVNGKKVKELYLSEYGFTIAYSKIKTNGIILNDLNIIF